MNSSASNAAALPREPLPTIKEFAFAHGVCTKTVRRWALAGKVVVVETLAGKRIDVRKCPLGRNDEAAAWHYDI